ncbi:hypothetical protein PGT21_030215 [Puccinia graminis f. sp. tritici]|nr:hypothetical protein PGT21_030215 [Puccinia graminis f. sp. tritici]
MVMSDLDSSQNDIDVVLKRESLIGQKSSRNFQADSYQENFPDERSHRTDLAWCDPHQKNMGMNFEPNGWKRKKLIRSHPGTSSNKHGIEEPQNNEVNEDQFQLATTATSHIPLVSSLLHVDSNFKGHGNEGESSNYVSPEPAFRCTEQTGLGGTKNESHNYWLFEPSSVLGDLDKMNLPQLMEQLQEQSDLPEQQWMDEEIHTSHHIQCTSQSEDHKKNKRKLSQEFSGVEPSASSAEKLPEISLDWKKIVDHIDHILSFSNTPQLDKEGNEGNHPDELNPKKTLNILGKVEAWFEIKNIPKFFMSDVLLGEFTDQFNEKIELIDRNKSGISPKIYFYEGFPVKITEIQTENLYLVRVLRKSSFDDKFPHKNKNQGSREILRKLNRLIQWLLFINTSVLGHLENGKRNYQNESISNHSLINWLFEEAFEPGNDRFPLHGTFQKTHNEVNYEPCQLVLLDYLSENMCSNEALKASQLIIQIYYNTFQPKILNSLMGYGSKYDLNVFLQRLTLKSIASNLKIHPEVESFDYHIEDLGISKYISFEEFPEELKPSRFNLKWKLILEPEEKAILENFDQLSIPSQRNINHRKTKVNGLPLVIHTSGNVSNQVPVMGFIWIILSKGRWPKREQIYWKLKSLIINLKACHLCLEEQIDSQKLTEKKDLKKQQLFEWIHGLLISKGNDELPIFGNFSLTKRADFNQNPIGPSDFSKVQILLMNFFSDSNSSSITIYLCLYLIFHWYNTQKSCSFIQNFKHETVYWDAMIKILKMRFVKEGYFSSQKLFNYLSR